MPGLDKSIVASIDPQIALARIIRDVRSDFILAPHYNAIFLKAGPELWERTSELLRSGKYQPELALTISVLKPGGFTRPGSILHPVDRIVYQALADLLCDTLEAQLDRTRTFSHVVVPAAGAGHMFRSEHESWNELQDRLGELAGLGGYFVKCDVANYFERIPQHHLINLMTASGCPPEIIHLLEEMFLAFQERDSFGIVQGLYPSDLFGNFYLSDFDAYCEIHDIASARFVDDMYLHFPTRSDAQRGLMQMAAQLRRDGLNLNESKSGIHSAERLIREETQLDRLFSDVVRELETERVGPETEVEWAYGFAAEWELEPEDEAGHEEQIATAAAERLYSSINDFPRQADHIERFALPLLRANGSEVAVPRSLEGVVTRPHLVGLYMAYLSRFFLTSSDVARKLEAILCSDQLIADYQRMYVFAGLMSAPSLAKDTVNRALKILTNRGMTQEVRALAAILAARHGTAQQRRAVRLAYEDEPSPYVRAAILYSARHFTEAERRTCLKAWGGHSMVNALIAQTLRGI
jgi:hypothetical protein